MFIHEIDAKQVVEAAEVAAVAAAVVAIAGAVAE